MNCISPIRIGNKNPNKSQLFKAGGTPVAFLEVPCGKCPACRANKQRDLEARCLLALDEYPYSVFGTWTFAQEPSSPDEAFEAFTLFRDRMRKKHEVFYYLVTLEECPSSGRYHLHSINFSKKQIKYEIYRKNWKCGYCFLEPVSGSSIRYVCKYVSKDLVRPDTGRRFRMSPGLGLDALRRRNPSFQRTFEEKFPSSRIPRIFPRYGLVGYRLPRVFVNLVRPRYWYDDISLLRDDVSAAFGYHRPQRQKDPLTGNVYYVIPKPK